MMLSNTEIKNYTKGLWLGSVILIAAIYLLYVVLSKNSDSALFPTITKTNIQTLATVVASFCFTMIGFVAAIGGYMLSISDKPSFNLWRANGYLNLYYHLYMTTIVFLVLTFGLCVLLLLANNSLPVLKLVMSLLIVNLIHIAIFAYAAINRVKNSDD